MTRAAVLDQAKELFVTRGFDATSVDEIARLSESSKGAVYHHFGDKREIFATVFRETQETLMRAAIEAVDASADDPWNAVQEATRSFLRSYAADHAARMLLRQAIEVLGWNRVRELDEETALPYLRAFLEEFQRNGVVIPVPPRAAADLLFRLYCDAVLLIANDDSGAERAARDVEQVVLALLGGLKNPAREPEAP